MAYDNRLLSTINTTKAFLVTLTLNFFMHYRKVLLVVLLFTTSTSQAQSVQDVFTTKQLTWYGLDFSLAKFVGEFNMISAANPKDATQVRDVLMDDWNDIIVREKTKYDLRKFYKKDEVLTNLAPVQTLNDKIDTDIIMAQNAPAALEEEKIQAALKKYGSASQGGIGLVFVVESFNKDEELGTIHITFFDTKSNKILLIKRLQTKPGGFGLRNYWVRTAYEAMNESSKNWKKWAAEAGVKLKS
jgi:hypothetical protein